MHVQAAGRVYGELEGASEEEEDVGDGVEAFDGEGEDGRFELYACEVVAVPFAAWPGYFWRFGFD